MVVSWDPHGEAHPTVSICLNNSWSNTPGEVKDLGWASPLDLHLMYINDFSYKKQTKKIEFVAHLIFPRV